VVVLVIAELDELAFQCLSRVELSMRGHESGTDSHDEGSPGGGGYNSALLNPVTTPDGLLHHVDHSLSSSNSLGGSGGSSRLNTIEQYLMKTEEGLHSHSRGALLRNSNDEQNINSVARDSQILHHPSPANIHEMVTLSLSRREYEAYLTFDYCIVRFNFVSMLLPLMNAKITGSNCGEESLFRVSEIGMFALMITRVLLNVYVDTMLTRHSKRSLLEYICNMCCSLLEHSLPCVGYVALMYLVFVDIFKPPMDDGGR
jgi:hypothetical protein